MGYKIRDGDIYKVVIISDNRFTIRYGYGTDAEREKWEPTPIYPDFISEPVYTADGFPFATAFQDICQHYKIKPDNNGESWCDNCIYFDKREDYIGLCKCDRRMQSAKRKVQNAPHG